jgi:two-component system NarL family sensor kinase
LQDVRRLAVDLHPKALDDFGLAAALERLTETWTAETGIEVDFAARLGDDEVSGDAALAIYRIVQEALTNVVKHAAARHVSILLTRKNERVVAVIEDDGQGFDPGGEDGGSGIRSMRERIELLDGRLRIESAPASGTTLVVEVPRG